MKSINKFLKNNLAIIAAVIIILFLLQDCHGRKDRNAGLVKQIDSLVAKVKRDSIATAKAYEAYVKDAVQAKADREQAQVEKQVIERQLTTSQGKVMYYAGLLDKYRYENDSSTILVQVGQDYVLACDSLQDAAQELVKDVEAYKDKANETEALMLYEVKIRDSIIAKGVKSINELRADFKAQTHFLSQALKAGKPRGRLLGGVGVMGNENDIFYGASAKLAYQSKGGKQYQIAGHALKGGVYYEASILITLIK